MSKTLVAAIRVALFYAVFAALWIRFSDIALQTMVQDIQMLTELQTIKGWFFVAVTAVLLFILTLRILNEIEESHRLDRLTGLLNHEMFMCEVDRKLALLKNQQYLVVTYLDIDGFSELNQKLGFEQADALLHEFSAQLLQHYQATVTLGRFPPDQFGVAFVSEDAQETLEHRLTELKTLFARVMLQHQQVVSCCLGVALGPGDGVKAKQLMSAAAEALQKAKLDAPDSMQFFNKELSELKAHRSELLRDLRQALKDGALSVVYQPQYALSDLSLRGIEVLTRWRHPKHGFVAPDKFIPLAEEYGFCDQISALVIKKTEQELVDNHLLGDIIPRVSINISAVEFNSSELMLAVTRTIEQTKVLKRFLQIEITETATINNIAKSAEIIHRLKANGIRFSVDDFGTGYTSLAMLKDLPIDEIKIDRFFVNDLELNGRANTIIAAVIAMANAFNVNTVAEGIETPEQLALLKEMGCAEAQGYYLAMPMAIKELTQHLQNKTLIPEPYCGSAVKQSANCDGW